MDLRKQILKEHTKANCIAITEYIGQNNSRFAELIEVYLVGPYRVTQRAAWPISVCVEQHPELIKPHLKNILDFVSRADVHVAVKRNTVRLLQFIDIPKRFQGRVADICFGLLQNKKETVAVKVFSMTVLANLCKQSSELSHELRIIIEDQLPYASAGYRSRASKVLKQLNQG